MPAIVTPLGRIILEVSSSGDREVPYALINESNYRVDALIDPDDDAAQLKFLIKNLNAPIPEGYAPLLGAFSVHVSASVEVEIRLSFSEDFANYDGGGDSGEWLDAITLENEKYSITIGTWDDEFLFSGRPVGVPSRLANLTPKPAAVFYSEDGRGLRICVPALFIGEEFCFPFHIAWAPYDAEKPSTWFAVGCQ